MGLLPCNDHVNQRFPQQLPIHRTSHRHHHYYYNTNNILYDQNSLFVSPALESVTAGGRISRRQYYTAASFLPRLELLQEQQQLRQQQQQQLLLIQQRAAANNRRNAIVVNNNTIHQLQQQEGAATSSIATNQQHHHVPPRPVMIRQTNGDITHSNHSDTTVVSNNRHVQFDHTFIPRRRLDYTDEEQLLNNNNNNPDQSSENNIRMPTLERVNVDSQLSQVDLSIPTNSRSSSDVTDNDAMTNRNTHSSNESGTDEDDSHHHHIQHRHKRQRLASTNCIESTVDTEHNHTQLTAV